MGYAQIVSKKQSVFPPHANANIKAQSHGIKHERSEKMDYKKKALELLEKTNNEEVFRFIYYFLLRVK